ncbi:peptidase S24/S26A/S26B [Halovivax asiaticus JCM 14624]|uniref:Peptidase S24/S26A/S26B n=1 Tax=Halovivax asiaticus JCM 14624 TaxID=1227490 RepID=M0BJ80_9EURY|nr:S26 family signal peptidase [Halovivax asiaticus]ELZ10951.1 peptidase S24/S26A/S26B [Halovivax asiaticus JCM 14624]
MTDRGSDSPPDESDRTGDRGDGPAPRPSTESERASDPSHRHPRGSETAKSSGGDDAESRELGGSGAREYSSESGGSSADEDRPSARGDRPVSIEDDGILRWFLKADSGAVVYVRDIASSVGFVMLIALILFGVSGVWPPMVAVESGSMEPNMERGDMIFVVEDDRFVGDGAIGETGIVTRAVGSETGHDKFGNPGDVIIFRPGGSEFETPVIHRAMFWVEKDERWTETKADANALGGASCNELATCPAPYDGFITKGDANGGYDQHPSYGADPSQVVKPEWIEGKAAYRIPWLGQIRLAVDDVLGNGIPPEEAAPIAALGGGLVLSRRVT